MARSEEGECTKGVKEETGSHLRRVEFILSDNLDGAFTTSLALDCLVDVGKGTVAHLLDQLELFQSLQMSA
jgi:hypothetical protein